MCSDLKSSVLKDGRRQKNGKIGCQTKEENLRIPKMCAKSKVKVKIRSLPPVPSKFAVQGSRKIDPVTSSRKLGSIFLIQKM